MCSYDLHLPVSRSAFFRGQAEHPAKGIVSKYLSTKDDPIYVAINTDGVFIIDMDDFVSPKHAVFFLLCFIPE